MRLEGLKRVSFATALIGGAAAGLCTGCSSSGTGAGGGLPPLTVCGQTLWSGSAGAVLDVVTGGGAKVTSLSAGFLLFLKVSDSCQDGASLTWEPSSAAEIFRSAKAADGKLAAVYLKPLAKSFTLILTSSAGKKTTVPVSLSALPVMHESSNASATAKQRTSP